MSRSFHHGCGRNCSVCSPGGRGPHYARQRIERETARKDVDQELIDIAEDRHDYADDCTSTRCEMCGTDLNPEDLAACELLGVRFVEAA